MEQYSNDQATKDPLLWEIAQKRSDFKTDLLIYLVCNVFMWVIWMVEPNDGIPWPVWATAGWGVGILFEYLDAYCYPEEESVEREYQKLKQYK